MSGISPASCWVAHKRLESWARAAKERALGGSLIKSNENSTNSQNSSLEEFNVVKETNTIQPPQNTAVHALTAELLKSTQLELVSVPAAAGHALQHQSKSYPTGGGQQALCRTPSVSSQSSLESSNSRQGHRGSSPQIRTFAPDGKVHQEAQHTVSYPLRTTSRSPSPLRAASLDIRCSSPGAIMCPTEARTPSPSQSSLASLTGGSASSCNSPVPASPRTVSMGRCLSPLHIPNHHRQSMENLPVAPPASPLGAIQPDLYLRKDGPLFINANPKNGPSLGRLHFRLTYDFNRSDLIIHLIEALDLTSSEQGGFNDPYVRVELLPKIDDRKRQTTVFRNNPNPYFDHHFKFPISNDELKTKTLQMQIFDYDRFSRNDVIGEVLMAMEEYDISGGTFEVFGDITKNKKPAEDLQEILVSLSFLPSAERLTVVLLKARNLIQPSDRENMDPFVKVYLLVNGKRIKKKKTAAMKSSCNPVWNEALTFSLSHTNLQNASVEIQVLNQGSEIMSSSPILGTCSIGPKQTGPERDHWLDMSHSLRKAIACWHTIRY
ncbi:unnamed protein product [Brassicogethes aeneus]|uniref:C2 domain-containing protein n=1 Tax=Brassicogethes aeneus TaxID=1431903 RepID=A0A9P0BDD7_BRAAE|nr:unnamed protein product [Brassicogethes aeneus]